MKVITNELWAYDALSFGIPWLRVSVQKDAEPAYDLATRYRIPIDKVVIWQQSVTWREVP